MDGLSHAFEIHHPFPLHIAAAFFQVEHATGGGAVTFERIGLAALLGVLGTVSLLIGAAIGLYLHPPRRLTAAVMAFGSGALIHALVVELAVHNHEHLVDTGQPAVVAWAWIGLGFLSGGLVYYGMNRLLESRGAALRKHSTAEAYLLERKRTRAAALLRQLSTIDLLRSLPPDDIHNILPHLRVHDLAPGDVVFRAGDPAEAVYLVESGRIALVVDDLSSAIAERPWDADHERQLRRRNPTTTRFRLDLALLTPAVRQTSRTAGDSFGEIAILSEGEHRTNAIALEPSRIFCILRADFLAMLSHSAGFRQAVEESELRHVLDIMRAVPEPDTARWQRRAVQGIQHVNEAERLALVQDLSHEKTSTGLPMAIFLGALLDGIPESAVVGASFVSLATFEATFLVAVFLSNLPESMSSAITMRRSHFSDRRIFALWSGLVAASAVAAALGTVFVAAAPPVVMTLVQSFAGGGILAMLAATMMPEAYEEGGPSVGIATIIGFVSAFFFTALHV